MTGDNKTKPAGRPELDRALLLNSRFGWTRSAPECLDSRAFDPLPRMPVLRSCRAVAPLAVNDSDRVREFFGLALVTRFPADQRDQTFHNPPPPQQEPVTRRQALFRQRNKGALVITTESSEPTPGLEPGTCGLQNRCSAN